MRIDAVGKETTAFCYFLFNLFLTSRRSFDFPWYSAGLHSAWWAAGAHTT